MRHMPWVLAALALLIVPVSAEEPDTRAEGIAVLEKVDAAIKAVDSVRFDIEASATGIAAQRSGAAKGTVVLEGWNGQVPERFWLDVEASPPGADRAVHVSAAGNGENYYLIDHTEKRAYEDMDPAVLGSNQTLLFGLAVIEFVHDRPFDDELGAETVELQGKEKIGDDDCYKIRVVYGANRGESIWFFSTEDYLPRRRVQVFNTPQGDGSIERTISNLEVNYQIDDAMFALKLPEGYEQIDDFAP